MLATKSAPFPKRNLTKGTTSGFWEDKYFEFETKLPERSVRVEPLSKRVRTDLPSGNFPWVKFFESN